MKKVAKLICVGVLLVCGLGVQPLKGLGESVIESHVPSMLRTQQASLVTPDSFRLGLDDYVTGFLDSSVKKVVLYVNDQTIRTGSVYSDGTFEVMAGDVITAVNDKVEIVGLDRRNNELDRQLVSIEQAEIVLRAEDYTLFDEEIRGIAGNQMSVVSLMINDELIRSVAVGQDDSFVIPVESGDIIDTDDFVEVVGSNSGMEIARITIPVNSLDLSMDFDEFIFERDTVISGTVGGRGLSRAKTAQLYVNRKRYARVEINGDGTFAIDSERNINHWKDSVVVAVLNEENEELGRFQLNLYKKYGSVEWSWDEATGTVTFGGGSFPNTGEAGTIVEMLNAELENNVWNDRYNRDVQTIVFTQPVEAAIDSSGLCSQLWNLIDIQGLDYLDVSAVQDMSVFFAHSYALSDFDISQFDTGNVTTMSRMFDRNRSRSLDISHFDTSNVTDMSYMFAENLFAEERIVTGIDTSSVINMEGMFYCTPQSGSSYVTQLDVSSFDTSNVTNMKKMFFGMAYLESLDLSNFDTSNVTDMSEMFGFYYYLKELNLSGFDTRNVMNMERFFDGTVVRGVETLVLGEYSIFADFAANDQSGALDGEEWTGPDARVYDSTRELLTSYNGTVPGEYQKTVDRDL